MADLKPPFTEETAQKKVKVAQDLWNTKYVSDFLSSMALDRPCVRKKGIHPLHSCRVVLFVCADCPGHMRVYLNWEGSILRS